MGSANQRSQAELSAASEKVPLGKVSRLSLKGKVRSCSSKLEISSRSSACFHFACWLTSSGISVSTFHFLLSSRWRALCPVKKRPVQQGAWSRSQFLASVHGLPLSFPPSTDDNKDDHQDDYGQNGNNRYNDGDIDTRAARISSSTSMSTTATV